MDPSAIASNCQAAGTCTQVLDDNTQHNSAAFKHSLVDRNKHGWRRIVLNFTPSWFSVVMGTGVVSILLHNLPYNGRWLYWISVAIFALNVLIFVTFAVISVLRYTLFRGLWGCMIRHPVQSLFLGTIPMGLATIINMMVFLCVPVWGTNFLIFTWVLWWIDVVLAIGTNFCLPFIMMYRHESKLSSMTAVWLLPIVAPIVAAASGSIVAEELVKWNPQHALLTVLVSYILWGCGLPLAMMVLVIYLQRLTLVALPPREVIVSVMLPLGPLGQGAFAIMNLGKQAMVVFPLTNTLPLAPLAGQIAYSLGLFIGLVMWGFGLVWLFLAIATLSRTRFPFNIGWWGFTFPLGVYTISTTTLATELPSAFFKVLGTIFSLVVLSLWIVVSVATFQRTITGELFQAPCIASWEKTQAERRAKAGEKGLRSEEV